MESSVLPLILLLMSNSYSEHTSGSVVKADSETGGSNSQEIPKPVLTVNPKTSPIFRGETVTLTCDVQMTEVTDWTYGWRCDGADVPYKEREYMITVQNNKTCMCSRTSQQNSSHWSNEVTLTVIEIPKPVLTVNPKTSQIFRGETVTLTCDVQGTEVTDWTYGWRCDGVYVQHSYEKEFKITATYSRYSHKCKCYAISTSRQFTSSWSNEVSFTVIDRKPVLTVNPKTSQIFRGETVTLTCDVQMTKVTDWTYGWFCDGADVQHFYEKEIKITATYSSYSHKCKCYARRTSTLISSSWSNEVSFTVIARPKLVVTVNPDHHVFRGETVTLTCDIQRETHTEWRYSWFKDGLVNPVSTERVYRITSDKSHSGKYSCRGERKQDSQRSDISDAVTLTVSDSKLNPELTSDTAGAALTGNTVTLICHMTQTAGWDFYWYKHTQNSEKKKTETNSYRVHIDSVSDGGQYWCRAGRGEPVYYTNYSDALWVNVTAQRPSVSLIISPSRRQHFSSHSLSLSCEGQSHSIWTVRRYTDSERMKDCSSTGSTCKISSLKTSDTGVYWCQSQSGENSQHINITVHDGDVILESPVYPVIERDTLTLRCLHRSTNSSILTANFYKDRSLLQKQTTGEMSIPTVSKSHEGFYSCKHGERGQSPESWISVTVSDGSSTRLVIWVVASVALLLIISLILLWRYKNNKDQQCINQQTSVQNQRTRPGESQTENCPLQSGASTDEVTYSDVTIKNKISVDKDDTMPVANNVTYSEVRTKVKKFKSKDVETSGPADLTYAQINIHNTKKAKGKDAGKRDVLTEMKTKNNQRGKSSECGNTVYSDLKQNTDRGDSAGVDATYAQVFNHQKKKTRKN
ncbi:Fc receptor-like protein 5 isoform X3 [Myxocyprinus asiaticus]|uniref:Fc receptor-like protein 5 isoform X3 n=1 Tax=Myxocyprinus asiaticus TaxID=70543 RepID=UPI002222B2EF|nr:Fc receptor-like protein 5 isoform X3 [Myxocyprinus asiaticus]